MSGLQASVKASEREASSADGLVSQRRLASFSVGGFRWFFLASLFLYGAINSLLLVRGYLVFDLTGSFTALGSIALAILAPAFFATLYGGVIADRMSKTLLIGSGLAVMGLFALWIGLMLALGYLVFWHVLVSSAVHGGVFGLISAAWYSVTPEIVPRPMIMNAVSLTMGGQNITRLITPAVFGFVLSVTDIDTAYFLMSGLFFASAVLMLSIKLNPSEGGKSSPKGEGKHLSAFVEGIKYTRSQPAVSALVIANIFLSGLSLPFLMLLPGYVKDVLQAGPEKLGLMVSFTSIGALTVTFFLTSMGAARRGAWFLSAGLLMGVAFVFFVNSDAFWLVYPLLVVVGGGLALRQSLSSSLCQTYVAQAYRGRVGSLISMQMTAGQIGTFLFGWLADMSSAQLSFSIMGTLLAVGSGLFFVLAGSLRKMQ